MRAMADWALVLEGGGRARSSAHAQCGSGSLVLGWHLWVSQALLSNWLLIGLKFQLSVKMAILPSGWRKVTTFYVP